MALTQISTDGIKNGTITGSDLATNVDLVDDQKLRLGTGNDLQIYHAAGAASHINATGLLNIDGTTGVRLEYNNATRLETTSDGVSIPTDSTFLRIGAGQDLDLHHNGTNSFIRNKTGNLHIRPLVAEEGIILKPNGAVELYHDNTKRFETTNSGITVAGNGVYTGNVQVNDNNFIYIGNSGDLQLSHNGTNSFIDNNLGDLYIQTTGSGDDIFIEAADDFQVSTGGETAILAIGDAEVQLYHNNAKKFETTSSGATITGALTTNTSGGNATLGSHLDLGDNQKARFGASDDLEVFHDGSNSYIKDAGTGSLLIRGSAVSIQSVSGEAMIEGVADGAVTIKHDNSTKLQTDAAGVIITGNLYQVDNDKLMLGNSSDLSIFHDGSNSYVKQNGTGDLILDAANGTADIRAKARNHIYMSVADSESAIEAFANGAVELYHNNSKKFETTTNGFKTQGSGQAEVIIGSTNAGGAVLYLDGDSDGDASGGANYAFIHHNTAGALVIRNRVNNAIHLDTNDTSRWYVYNTGHFVPAANNAYDIGTSSVRVRNIYTNDLNLSNEGSSNDVDGTWGSYTIQEGAEDLFLVNKRNGKKYKFNLTEVS